MLSSSQTACKHLHIDKLEESGITEELKPNTDSEEKLNSSHITSLRQPSERVTNWNGEPKSSLIKHVQISLQENKTNKRAVLYLYENSVT